MFPPLLEILLSLTCVWKCSETEFKPIFFRSLTPSADLYNTVKTASAAVNQQLSGKELTVMVDGSGLSEDEVASLIQSALESGIERCIVFEPSLAQ